MPSLAHFFSSFARSGVHLTLAIAPIPGLGAVSDLLSNIIDLCERIPQNKYVHPPHEHVSPLARSQERRSPFGLEMSPTVQGSRAVREDAYA